MNKREKESTYDSPVFRRLIREKKTLLIPAVAFFLSFYLFLPLMVMVFPEITNRQIYHLFTVGWGLAFAQFLMVWVLGLFYCLKAKQFDNLVEKLKRQRENG
jgi:uncharacterized membrane protein (DUF485 family)